MFAQNNNTQPGRFDAYSLDNNIFPIDTIFGYNNDTLILSQLEDTLVVFNFWSTHCSPCLSEIKQLNILKKNYSSYKIKFIAISSESKDEIKATLKNRPFNFLQFNIEQQLLYSEKIIRGFPTHLILDQNRVIKFYKFGGSSTEDITSILTKEIEKLNPSKITP